METTHKQFAIETNPASCYWWRLLALGFLMTATNAAAITVDLQANADSFMHGNMPTSNFGTASLVRVKNGDDTPIFSRKAYLRYDLSGLPPAIAAASLNLEFVESSEGMGGTTLDWNFEVFGLAAGHAGENWNESTINWDNAPANDTATGAGLMTGATSLGTFNFTGRTASISFSGTDGTAVRDFLRQNTTNDLATFLVVRNTTAPPSDNYVHAFAASEHATAALHPLLNITAVPEPGTALAVSLFSLMLATRRRTRSCAR